MRRHVPARARIGLALMLMTLVSIGLYAVAAFDNRSWEYSYFVWNLLLAWVPLVLALWLLRTLRRHLWSSWRPLTLTVAWLAFLPNSFYIITDYIHLNEVPRTDLVFDVIMFSSFVFTGVVLGYVSLYLIHRELLKRLSGRACFVLAGIILLYCSYGIYIGRHLRWNTWDIVANPTGLLFGVSESFISASARPQMLATTLGFFVLLGGLYVMIWQFTHWRSGKN